MKEAQRSFAAGELAPGFYAATHLPAYRAGAKLIRNMLVSRHGSLRKRPGMELVDIASSTLADDGLVRFIEFRFSSEQAYALVVSPGETFIVYRGALLNGSGDPEWSGATAYQRSDAVTYNGQRWVSLINANTGNAPAEGNYWRQTDRVLLYNDYAQDELRELRFDQIGDVLTIVHGDHPTVEITRLAHQRWQVREPVLPCRQDLGRVNNLRLTSVPADDGSWHKASEWTWVVTEVAKQADGSWREIANCVAASVTANVPVYQDYDPVKLAWDAQPFTSSIYRIYRGGAGLYGLVGESDIGEFTDRCFAPDYSHQPPVPVEDDLALFAAADKYPRTICAFKQRRIVGGTNQKRWTLYASEVGKLRDFCRNPRLVPNDDQAFALGLAAIAYEEIKAVVPARSLLVLTSEGEWEITSDGAFAAANANAIAHSRRGSGDLPPLLVGDTVLFANRHGSRVYELAWDGRGQTWASRDLTILASHLFEGGRYIVDWTYQSEPDPVVWCVLDDGTLLSLTYDPGAQVVAWARHETAGKVESIVCIAEDGAEVVYLGVRRTLQSGGQATSLLCVERMRDRGRLTDFARCCFLDCSVQAWGGLPAAQTQSDLATGFVATDVGGLTFYEPQAGVFKLQSLFYHWDASWIGRQIVLLPGGGTGGDTMLVLLIEAVDSDHVLSVTVLAGTAADWAGHSVDEDHWIARISSVSGLERFEGSYPANGLEAQPVEFADGTPRDAGAITGGVLTLQYAAGWVLVGLPYNAEVELLDVPASPLKEKALVAIGLDMEGAGYPAVGTSLSDLSKAEDLEVSSEDPTTRSIARRIVESNVAHTMAVEALGAVQQTKPFPLSILAIGRTVDYALD